MDDLLERGVFEVVHEEAAAGHCKFGSRFVDTITNTCNSYKYEKYCLVAQNYNDKPKLLTFKSTVQRASQRLLVCLEVCSAELMFVIGEIWKVYTQSSGSH